MKLKFCIYIILYTFLVKLEPQSSIYIRGLYGGAFIVFYRNPELMTTYNLSLCFAVTAHAQCLCILFCCALYDIE